MNLKSQLRKEFLSKREDFKEYKYLAANNIIYAQLIDVLDSIFKIINSKKNTLGIYYPLQSEPDIFKIAISSNYRICLPKITDKGMVYVKYRSGNNLIKSKFSNLYMPSSNLELTPNIALIPGLSFDMKGYRLGFGRGYFDEYLAKKSSRNIVKIGVCYDELLNVLLPHDVYDIRMDYLITEKNIYRL